jgi:hypothetical protein
VSYSLAALAMVLAPTFPGSRWGLRWYMIVGALLVPVCLLALAEARLRRRD